MANDFFDFCYVLANSGADTEFWTEPDIKSMGWIVLIL